MRGLGRALLAATLLTIAGTLNIIYGIGALDNAHIFVNDKRFIFTAAAFAQRACDHLRSLQPRGAAT